MGISCRHLQPVQGNDKTYQPIASVAALIERLAGCRFGGTPADRTRHCRGAACRSWRCTGVINRLSAKRRTPKVCHCEEAAGRRGNLGKAVTILPGLSCDPAGYCEIATSAYGLLAMTNRGPSAILTIACTGCKCVAGSGMPLPYNFPRDLLLSLYTAAAFFSTAAAVFFRRDLRFRPFCDNIRGRY